MAQGRQDMKSVIKEHLKELKGLGARTQDSDRQCQDSLATLAEFPYLRPTVGVLPGTNQPLLRLEGTVQMMYKNVGYYVPIAVYLRDEHPTQPPICIVTPTPEMTIKPNHRHVDMSGIVYLPYLHEWTKKSTLSVMIHNLASVFMEDPFIYKKPQQQATHTPQPGKPGGGVTPPYMKPSASVGSEMKMPVYAVDSGNKQPPAKPAPPVPRKPAQPLSKQESQEMSKVMITKAKEMDDLDSVLENSFRCPISMEIMVDPVFAADGHTYERTEMERWLVTKTTSPLTNEVLPHKVLVPNHNLRSQIREYLEKHPNAR